MAERKPRHVIERLPARPDYRLIGLTRTGRVIAFAIVFVSIDKPVALLEYMATSKQLRNMNFGAHLFRIALDASGPRVMLVEVDSEREPASDRSLRLRRKHFYLRQGCVQLPGLDYAMPVVSDKSPPVMDLLVHPNGLARTFDSTTVRAWLETVYSEVYGRSVSDPAIAQMMNTYECGN